MTEITNQDLLGLIKTLKETIELQNKQIEQLSKQINTQPRSFTTGGMMPHESLSRQDIVDTVDGLIPLLQEYARKYGHIS